jgi:hypothetical protein
MKRRYLTFLLLLLLLFSGFAFVSWAIVKIKLKELKYYVTKEQVLNLQLSSDVLKEKFKQLLLYKEDYKKELSISIMDSTVLNTEKDNLDISLDNSEEIGLVIVNGVRFLSFKDSLKFLEDKDQLIKLQYAFHFERTRKYKKASQKYIDLETSILNKNSDEYAFALLHNGFCLGLLGETDKALEKLYETESKFPGTHFAISARVLIELLLMGDKKQKEIVAGTLTLEDKIQRLYNNGFYKQVLKELDAVEEKDITIPIQYMRARSLEETDALSIATKEYLRLVVQKERPDVAQKANRRLVMISNIYQKNKELADYSKNKATELGDKEMVSKVEDGTKLILETKVLTKIETMISKGEMKEELAEEIKKDTEEQVVIEKEEITQLIQEVEESKFIDYFTKLKNIKLLIVLADERTIEGNTLLKENESIEVKSGEFSVFIKDYLLSEISLKRVETEGSENKPKEEILFKVTLIDGQQFEARNVKFIEDNLILDTKVGKRTCPLDALKKIESF